MGGRSLCPRPSGKEKSGVWDKDYANEANKLALKDCGGQVLVHVRASFLSGHKSKFLTSELKVWFHQ